MRQLFAILTAVAVLSVSVYAGAPDDVQAKLDAMQAQLEKQQELINNQSTEIQKLKAVEGESWLSEAEAAQVRSLVHEVLADADTRRSLDGSGVSAGYDNGFYIMSNDGTFKLVTNAQIQNRWTFNVTDSDSDFIPVDDTHHGFSVRRAKLSFSGHVIDPSLTFKVSLAHTDGLDIGISVSEGAIGADNGDPVRLTAGGDTYLEDVYIEKDFGNGWTLRAGQFKVPLLRDELVDSSMQVAVERGVSTDLMSADRSQGIMATYTNHEGTRVPYRVMVMLHDGTRQTNTDFDQQLFEIALAARVEILVDGTFEQFNDYHVSSADERGILVGVAMQYEIGNDDGNLSAQGLLGSLAGLLGASGGVSPDVFTWTIDVSAELPNTKGLSIYLAIIGQHVNDISSTALGGAIGGGADDLDQYAFQFQIAAAVMPDKLDLFFRYEYLAFPDDGVYMNLGAAWFIAPTPEDDQHVITIGGSYYLSGHASKISADLVILPDMSAFGDSGAGVLVNDGDQVVFRLQYQLLY